MENGASIALTLAKAFAYAVQRQWNLPGLSDRTAALADDSYLSPAGNKVESCALLSEPCSMN